jgi:hypothetical protein
MGSPSRCPTLMVATTRPYSHPYTSSSLAKIPAEDEIGLDSDERSANPKRQAAITFAKALMEKRSKVWEEEFVRKEVGTRRLVPPRQAGPPWLSYDGSSRRISIGAIADIALCWAEAILLTTGERRTVIWEVGPDTRRVRPYPVLDGGVRGKRQHDVIRIIR